MSDISSYLFETQAIKFCQENKPFWYTSGKIGPYFINTHFVYGSEKEASEFLSFIDEALANKETLPEKVFQKSLEQYTKNEIYHNVLDTMKEKILANIDVSQIDYISGGERRDWFFSNMIAHLLDKPHITIYKDLSTMVSDSHFTTTSAINSLEGKRILHIADLVTVASSYLKAWIPAIHNLGAKMEWTVFVVDRMQGGKDKLEEQKVKAFSLVQVDDHLFETALQKGIINETQFNMLEQFFHDPDTTMRNFLLEHPEFIQNSLAADEKTAKRAKLLVDNDLYQLK